MTPNPRPAPKKSSTALTVALAIGAVLLVGCCGVGTLAAIAIPNFIRFQQRAKQAECRSALKSIFESQKALFAETKRYERTFAAIGYSPFPRRRYTYFMGSGAELAPDLPGAAAVPASALPPISGGQPPGVTGPCPTCSFAAACATNLDGDVTLDVWSVSSDDRLVGTRRISAGEPYNDVNDVTD